MDIRSAAGRCTYHSGKNYLHATGLSCCFRQWRAKSHCNQLHGYALAVELDHGATELDEYNWVVDFGSLKPVKSWLEHMFDHTCLVAHDDPQISIFKELQIARIIDLRIVDATGCEAFARLIWEHIATEIATGKAMSHIDSLKVTVREHEGNWASYGQ